jgi:HEAT repeat protein
VRARRYLTVGILVLAILGGCWWLVLRSQETEPVYRGKTLSAWLNETDPQTAKLTDEAAEAVRQIGTNARHYLLKEIGAPNRINSLVEDIATSPLAKKVLPKFRFETGAERWHKADKGISSLGQMGALMLAQGLTNSDKRVRQGCAAACMNHQDFSGILLLPLLGSLKDQESEVRGQAAASLHSFTNEPALVIPALIKSLDDPQEINRIMAMYSLGCFGTQAESAVPLILKELVSAHPTARLFATNALKQIDPARAAKAGVK